jgi:hypothetical protein
MYFIIFSLLITPPARPNGQTPLLFPHAAYKADHLLFEAGLLSPAAPATGVTAVAAAILQQLPVTGS